MTRSLQRRLGVAVVVAGLSVAAAGSLPTTAARFGAQTRNPGPSSFEAGEFDPTAGLEEVVCAAVPDAPLCAPATTAKPVAPSPDEPSEESEEESPAPVEVAVAPLPTPTTRREPRPSPSPTPSSLPEPGERCETPECVEEAVHVVGVFADELEQLHQSDPGQVPEAAMRTISEFADELRALPEPPEEDLPLPEDTRVALGDLVEAGVLEPFAPECVADVGQLAALIAERQAAREQAADGATPQPSPTATCAGARPTPEPRQQPTPTPQAGSEPQPGPTGEPEPSEYPYDGPGHRVRRMEPQD